MLACADLVATYRQGTREARVLDGVGFVLDSGAAAITGPSGSGKSTLLRILSGLQAADRGTITTGTGEEDAARKQDGRVGVALIHQDYRLVPFLTVAENIDLARELTATSAPHGAPALTPDDLLELVGVGGMRDRLPVTLSGGEQQRVAIARALATRAAVLLADEPTGALDEENSAAVADLLRALGESGRATVLVATHDPTVYQRMPRHLRLTSGTVVRVV